MAAARQRRKTAEAEFRVGSKVSFVFGGRRVRATIVEDRGNIGVQGRRLLRVRLKRMAAEDLVFEMPADDLKPA